MKRACLALAALLIGLAGPVMAADGTARREDLDRIRATVTDFLRSQNPGSAIHITVTSLDPRLRLAPCTRPLAAALGPGSRGSGYVTVSVRCNGAEPWHIYVPARVQRRALVVVAVRPLAYNEILRSGDVTLVERDIATVSGEYLSQLDAAVGKRMKLAVAPGVALTRAMVQNPPIIHRGDAVSIVAEDGEISVRVAGEALSDAGPGDTVRVRNTQTKRVVEGTAVAPGTVKVMM
jgi:flagella basal body P-ring formation protein FlgA